MKYEGNSGSTPFTFTVNRIGDQSGTTTVFWTLGGANPNPAANADFTGFHNGTFTFAPGQSSQTLTVPVLADRVAEPDENFAVQLVVIGGSGASLVDGGTALGTILNDDNSLTVTPLLTNGSGQIQTQIAEGNSGATPYVFAVTRTGYATHALTVDWAAIGDASGGAAASAADFTGPLTGTLSFAAGQMTQNVTVQIAGDTQYEANETFRLHLANPSDNSQLNDSLPITILNDDASFSIADHPLNDLTEGQTQRYVVTRTGDSTLVQSVDWHVYGIGANAAGLRDFTGPLSGTLSFAAGQTQQTIDIATLDDNLAEPTEQFRVVLDTPTNGASIGADHLDSSIVDNDTVLAIHAVNATRAEGDSLGAAFVFQITRAGNVESAPSLVHWIAYGSGANPATASDFQGRITSGTISVGSDGAMLTLGVAGDTAIEPDETFGVLIQLDPASQATATIATNRATGTILNDDLVPAADLLPSPTPLPGAAAPPQASGGLADPWAQPPLPFGDALHGTTGSA